MEERADICELQWFRGVCTDIRACIVSPESMFAHVSGRQGETSQRIKDVDSLRTKKLELAGSPNSHYSRDMAQECVFWIVLGFNDASICVVSQRKGEKR